MSRTGVVLTCVGGGVAFVLLLAWVTWTFVFTSIDRTFWLLLFGYGDVGGQ